MKIATGRKSIDRSLILAAVVTLVQLPLLWCWPADWFDTGFNMTFYENIYTHPASVEYNFMYWLTGIVGGAVHAVLPGIFPLRLLALLINVCCALLVNRVVSDFRAMLVGTMMVSFGLYCSDSVFHYNHLTLLLTVSSLVVMMRGRRRGMLLSGILAGVMVFARVSNIAGLGYMLLTFLFAQCGRRWKSALIWLGGYAAGVAACLLLMLCLGHLGIFISNMRELADIAVAGEASHGIGPLMDVTYDNWWHIYHYRIHTNELLQPEPVWVPLMCVILALLLIFTRRPYRYEALLATGAMALMILSINFRRVLLTDASIMYTLTFCACVGIVISFFTPGWRKKGIAAAMMLAILPLGSDNTFLNLGPMLLWLALPVGIAAMLAASRLKPRNDKAVGKGTRRRNLLAPFVFGGWCAVAAVTSFFCVWQAFANNRGNSAYRTRVTNNIRAMVSGNVPEGTEILVYGGAPMLYYLTGTLPAYGNSWPEQLAPAALAKKLADGPDPEFVVLMDCDPDSPLPLLKASPVPGPFARGVAGANRYHTSEKSGILLRFLGDNGYRPMAAVPGAILYRRCRQPN